MLYFFQQLINKIVIYKFSLGRENILVFVFSFSDSYTIDRYFILPSSNSSYHPLLLLPFPIYHSSSHPPRPFLPCLGYSGSRGTSMPDALPPPFLPQLLLLVLRSSKCLVYQSRQTQVSDSVGLILSIITDTNCPFQRMCIGASQIHISHV